MSKKAVKKAVSFSLAALACTASLATLTGCESARPEIKMQLSFQNKTYEIEYVLYRKLAPSTVEHFLSLVENEYYDGMCIHNYDSSASRLYTGAYTYDKTASENQFGLVYKPYFETVKAYASLPQTVWSGKKGEENAHALYTLYGEFAKNHFTIKNGSALQQTFGSLTMFYTDKGDANGQRVDVNPVDTNEWLRYDYQYNSTTSEFFISFNESASTNEGYCTFAAPKDEGKEALADLIEAVQKYIEEECSEDVDAFAPKCNVDINLDDPYAVDKDLTAQYAIPKAPIVVQSIKVLKY